MTETTTETYTVYRLYDSERNLLYVGCTKQLEQRLGEHRQQSPWWPGVDGVEHDTFPNHEAATAEEVQQIQTLAPRHNRRVQQYATVTTERLDGDKLRSKRTGKYFSQRELAILADVSHETINRLERGARNPNVYPLTMRKIADALGVDPSDITEE